MARTKTKLLLAAIAALATSRAGALAAVDGPDRSPSAPRAEERAESAARTTLAPSPRRSAEGARSEAEASRSEAQPKALADWQEVEALQQRVP